MGTINDDEFTEFNQELADSKLFIPPKEHAGESKKKGRKKIEEQWTKVISIEIDELDKFKVTNISQDLLMC